MVKAYNYRAVEQRWRREWEKNPIFAGGDRPGYPCPDLPSFPSGNNLNVADWKKHVISDVCCLYQTMNGPDINCPAGWDAAGVISGRNGIKTDGVISARNGINMDSGVISARSGMKTGRSQGGVFHPVDLVENYGCDCVRMYLLSIGPPESDPEWDDRGIDGVYRFLCRFYDLVGSNAEKKDFVPSGEMVRAHQNMIAEISRRFENFRLNTVVSGFMEYTNRFIALRKKEGGVDQGTLADAVTMIAPFAPHIGEELWRVLGGTDSVFRHPWPKCDEKAMKEGETEIPVQIRDKVRAVITLPADASRELALEAAKKALGSRLDGKTIVGVVYIPNEIINIVVK